MKKADILAINARAVKIWENALGSLEKKYLSDYEKKRLLSCSAWVYDTPNYYVLQSYNTVIAVIEKETGLLVDMLRYVYGYTSTSGKHISKFWHEYAGNTVRRYYDCERLTWKKV